MYVNNLSFSSDSSVFSVYIMITSLTTSFEILFMYYVVIVIYYVVIIHILKFNQFLLDYRSITLSYWQITRIEMYLFDFIYFRYFNLIIITCSNNLIYYTKNVFHTFRNLKHKELNTFLTLKRLYINYYYYIGNKVTFIFDDISRYWYWTIQAMKYITYNLNSIKILSALNSYGFG